MHAEKLNLQTDENGQLKGLPALPPHIPVEVILLFSESGSQDKVRRPSSPIRSRYWETS